jgi:hypothetical protein
VRRISRPGHSTAFAFSTCFSFGSEISAVSKYDASAEAPSTVFRPTSLTSS